MKYYVVEMLNEEHSIEYISLDREKAEAVFKKIESELNDKLDKYRALESEIQQLNVKLWRMPERECQLDKSHPLRAIYDDLWKEKRALMAQQEQVGGDNLYLTEYQLNEYEFD